MNLFRILVKFLFHGFAESLSYVGIWVIFDDPDFALEFGVVILVIRKHSMSSEMVVIPIVQRQMIPTVNAGYEYIFDLFLYCFPNVCEQAVVSVEKTNTLSTIPKETSEEACLLIGVTLLHHFHSLSLIFVNINQVSFFLNHSNLAILFDV